MKVIGYTRVSMNEQADHGCSLAAQSEKIRAYAELYGHELVRIVDDPGQSAKSLTRPGLQAALQAIRNGEAEGLLVAKLDRLSRSIGDMASLFAEYFGEKSKVGATLLAVSDQIDTQSAGGRLVLNVMTSASQWEREVISERTKTALAHLKSQGVKLGRPCRRPEDEDQTVVERIDGLKAEGKSLRAIAEALNAEGFATRRGGKWGAETVRLILARKEAA